MGADPFGAGGDVDIRWPTRISLVSCGNQWNNVCQINGTSKVFQTLDVEILSKKYNFLATLGNYGGTSPNWQLNQSNCTTAELDQFNQLKEEREDSMLGQVTFIHTMLAKFNQKAQANDTFIYVYPSCVMGLDTQDLANGAANYEMKNHDCAYGVENKVREPLTHAVRALHDEIIKRARGFNQPIRWAVFNILVQSWKKVKGLPDRAELHDNVLVVDMFREDEDGAQQPFQVYVFEPHSVLKAYKYKIDKISAAFCNLFGITAIHRIFGCQQNTPNCYSHCLAFIEKMVVQNWFPGNDAVAQVMVLIIIFSIC